MKNRLFTALLALAGSLFAINQLSAQGTYCPGTGYVNGNVKIGDVHLGAISSHTTVGGYIDSTHQLATLYKGITYTLRVDPAPSGIRRENICGAYIDWNHDYQFTDSTERLVLTQIDGGRYFTGAIKPPSNATTADTTRLRLVLFFQESPRVLSPCGTTVPGNDGSVQDFSILVRPALATAPPCPTVLAPASGGTNVNPLGTFSWSRVLSAQGYRVYLDTVAAPARRVATVREDSTAYNPPRPLLGGKTYHLRVTAFDSVGESAACTEVAFTVSAALPACPVVTSPAPGDSVARRFTIAWRDSAALFQTYQVRVGPTNPPTQVVGDSIIGNNFIVPTQPASSTVYVLVLARNSNGLSTGCTAFSVLTKAPLVYCVTDNTVGGGLSIDSLYIGGQSVGRGSTPAVGLGYRDYSALIQDSIAVGQTDTLKVRANNSLGPNRVVAWADWNSDGEFDLTAEAIQAPGDGQNFRALIRPPAIAARQRIRVRVVLDYVQADQPLEPCGIHRFDGSAFDITLIVSDSLVAVKPALAKRLHVWPTPLPTGQSLHTSPLAAPTTWQVYDAAGRLLSPGVVLPAGAALLPLPSLLPGLYMGRLGEGVVRFGVE